MANVECVSLRIHCEFIISMIQGHSVFFPLVAMHVPYLKEYYEIVGESRPLSAFFPTHADFFTEMLLFFSIAFYGILHEFCSVLRCDILGICFRYNIY